MYYVYLIESKVRPEEHYTGYSLNIAKRLVEHNAGKSVHTNKFKPWDLIAYFSFTDMKIAKNFEEYLKSGSGRVFLKKHFLKN